VVGNHRRLSQISYLLKPSDRSRKISPAIADGIKPRRSNKPFPQSSSERIRQPPNNSYYQSKRAWPAIKAGQEFQQNSLAFR
jgi:hypothetical protein